MGVPPGGLVDVELAEPVAEALGGNVPVLKNDWNAGSEPKVLTI